MKVKDLFDMMCSADLIEFDLFEINECVALHTNSDEMARDDDLHEEWKNAEIVINYLKDWFYKKLIFFFE